MGTVYCTGCTLRPKGFVYRHLGTWLSTMWTFPKIGAPHQNSTILMILPPKRDPNVWGNPQIGLGLRVGHLVRRISSSERPFGPVRSASES